MRASIIRVGTMSFIAAVIFGAGMLTGALLMPVSVFAQEPGEDAGAGAGYFKDAGIIVQFTAQHNEDTGSLTIWVNGHPKDRAGVETDDVWVKFVTRYEEPVVLGFTPDGATLFQRMRDVGDRDEFEAMLAAWRSETPQ